MELQATTIVDKSKMFWSMLEVLEHDAISCVQMRRCVCAHSCVLPFNFEQKQPPSQSSPSSYSLGICLPAANFTPPLDRIPEHPYLWLTDKGLSREARTGVGHIRPRGYKSTSPNHPNAQLAYTIHLYP